jgi:O-6-methylguanine DNA methyltransferase
MPSTLATLSRKETLTTTTIETPLGVLSAGATDDGVCLLEFAHPRTETETRIHGAVGRHRLLDQLRAELADYFAGALSRFTVPLVIRGTPFQEAVWQELLRIPFGATCSYADVARAIGAPRASRAVGAANGQNRICILIPCHRVIASGGSIGGYGGGLDRKRFLLDLERRV